MDPRWAYHHRGVASGFQVCTISITRQELGARVYDAESNTWDTESTVLWTGNARIQPVLSGSVRAIPTNDTAIQQVSVHIDFDGNTLAGSGGAMADIRPGDYLLVTNSPIDSTLEKFIYIVKSVMNSSNAWQRTLMCEVDMEADPNA